MSINRLFCAVALIVLASCAQKENLLEVQETSRPFVIELDTLNALDVGFKCRIESTLLRDCEEIGVIYYKNSSSIALSENILPLYVNGDDSKADEYIKYIRVEPEEEYAWKPYLVQDNIKTTYKSSSFRVGKEFSVASIQPRKGCVGLEITVPFTTGISYMYAETPQDAVSREMVIAKGKHRTIKNNGLYYIPAQLKANAHYYLYLVANEGISDYTEVMEYEFDTDQFVEAEMLELLGVDYNGFTMWIDMPSSVKVSDYGTTGSRAVRYSFGNILMYNMVRSRGFDDYFSLLYNGQKYLQKDCLMEISDETIMGNVDYDVNNDGVLDENDVDKQWDPIVPGEPIVFLAGEFEWMQLPDDHDGNSGYKINGFPYPFNWEPGYYLPCIDSEKYFGVDHTKSIIDDVDLTVEMDKYWTGAFQRKVFTVKEPDLLNAEMRVNITDVTASDAHIELVPGDGVYSYYLCILNKTEYNMVLALMEGHEDYLQWFTTSHVAAFEYDAINKKGKCEFDLSDYLTNGYVQPYSEYHVLVTALGNKEGTSQKFIHEVFYTTAYESRVPVIEVTPAVEYCTPGYAVFNIRNTDLNYPITEAYFAANYIAEWEKAFNEGQTYISLTNYNVPFTPSELEYINSKGGLYHKVPGESHQIMRMAVLGYNKEGRNNELLSEESSGVADCMIP